MGYWKSSKDGERENGVFTVMDEKPLQEQDYGHSVNPTASPNLDVTVLV